jgi:hypothetical protein
VSTIRWAGFQGENRAIHPKLLNDAVGTVSRNQKPGRGDLRPWREPVTVASVPAGRRTIYRMGRDVPSDANYWLSWTGVVHAVRGYDAEDTTERTYFTGDGAPKVTDNTMALAGAPYPTATRPLGMPAPASAPSVTVSQVSNTSPDVGKHVAYLSSTAIAALVAGDVLQVVFADSSKPVQSITLTGPTVTKATLATQLDALLLIDAAALAASDTTSADGVKITSNEAGASFKIQKKTGTSSDFDPAVVTLITLGTSVGATPYVVDQTWLTANAKAGDRWQITADARAPVSVTLTNGAGTFPPSVTTASLRSSLSSVDGLTLTLTQTAQGVQQLEIVSSTTPVVPNVTGVVVKKINPATANIWSDLSSSSIVTQPVVANASYFYAYTFVNSWGWESAPSPPSAKVVRKPEDTATIGGFSAVPPGNYGINRIRVYRTQSTESGNADFFFLREIPLATITTTDDNRALGEVMPSTAWVQPPDDLSNLTALWNGMLAGISGNSVRFCEAYTPYAWPIAYDIVPADSKPVALGVFGQNLLILTTARPVLAAGSSPESMDSAPMEFSQACIAAQSAVSMGSGVAWASEDGLCWYGAGGARILTAGVMLRDDWQALRPATIIGKMYEGLYFGSYDDGTGRKGFLIDPGNPTGIFFLDAGYAALHFDELRDQLYVLDGTSVRKWDAGALMTVRAVSKVFRAPSHVNFGACEVVADAYPVTLKVWADGVLVHTQVVTSRYPFRLPGGFAALDWQLELIGTHAVQGVAMASTMQELAQS